MGNRTGSRFGIGVFFKTIVSLGLLSLGGLLIYNAVGQYKSFQNFKNDVAGRFGGEGERAMPTSGSPLGHSYAPRKPLSSPAKNKIQLRTRGLRTEALRESGLGRFDEMIRHMRSIPLAYNHPRQMYLGRKTQVSLSLKTGKDSHLDVFEGTSGDVIGSTTKVSSIMVAQLDGPGFDVTPSGPQRKLLTSAAPASWTWYVTPKRPGENQVLNLELSAVLEEGGRLLPPVTLQTFRTKIEVDVRWWDRALYYIATFDPLYQLMGAIGALASAGLFLRGVWSRWKTDREAV